MKPNFFNLLTSPIKKVFLFFLNLQVFLNFLLIYLAISSSKKDLPLTIQQYKNALKLGYTKQITEIYQTAGVEFNFSETNIQDLAQFLKKELDSLLN